MASLTRLASIEVSAVRGLAGKRSRELAKAGITTVADLLHHVPRRYIDRSRVEPIARVPMGEEVTVIGEVDSVSLRRPRKNLAIIEAHIVDDSGSIKAVWFNQTFRVGQLRKGTLVAISGVVERFGRSLQMKSPDADVLHSPKEGLVTGRVVPIHPAVGEVSPGVMRRAMHNALRRARPIPDPVPEELIVERGLIARDRAYTDIHFPDSIAHAGPARRRLVYDELLRLELALAMRKRRQMVEARGISHDVPGVLVGRFVAGLPYDLTGAQRRVLEEIAADLRASHPMHRLLQGEVGSGKTVVAVATLLDAVEGGWQGAFMAPTEVLAEQHFRTVSALIREAGLAPTLRGEGAALGMSSLFDEGAGPAVKLALLTGSAALANYHPGIGREQLRSDIADGAVDIVVGTHALIQEGVRFHRLGVAVVDEQHRFGVAQRVQLKEKADAVEPDMLIMTATPIPRTLAMTLYGDLDVSLLDEMPPGRTPVETIVVGRSDEAKAWELITAEVAEGRQAFVVCPLVEDSPKVEAASATAERDRLAGLMPELRVGLIHGQMRPADKEAAMESFRAGETDVLVATTVIEVGIDLPNATVMVIEDADRFGLSQLHQLRGRVGRAQHPGTCVLLADPTTEEGEQRLAAMASTTDGFVLADEDLRIRGQGTIFGTRQAGMADLKLADLLEDFEILVAARRDAFAMVDADPELKEGPELAEEVRTLLGASAGWLFVS